MKAFRRTASASAHRQAEALRSHDPHGTGWHRWLLIFGGILAMLGLIGLIIGVVFTIPLAVGALLYAYEDLCNPPAATGQG